MKKLFVSAVVMLAGIVASAGVNVQSIERVSLPNDQAVDQYVLSADGNMLVYSTGRVINKMDLGTNAITKVGEVDHASRLTLSPDARHLVFFKNSYKDHLRYQSVHSMDLNTGAVKEMVKPTRKLSYGMTVTNEGVNAVENGKLRVKSNAGVKAQKEVVAAINYGHLDITIDGKTTTIDPQGRGSYLWPSISPDGTKVLYWLVGQGCYVCDLDGSNAKALGFGLCAPVWAGNDMVLGMDQKDDSEVITESVIVAADLDGTQTRLTDTNLKCLNPQATADGSRAAFITADGQLYIINFNK